MSDFPKYVSGQRPPNSARQLQNLADAAEAMANLQVRPPLTMTRYGKIATLGIRSDILRPAIVQAFTLVEMFDDYMVTRALNGTKDFFVAKPYLLQRTPFDSQVPEPPPERIGVHYEYTDAVTRDAIRGEGDDEERENQIVIPQFVATHLDEDENVIPGDTLFAIRTIFGGTGVTTPIGVEGQVGGVSVSWLDLNVDGREWAKVPG